MLAMNATPGILIRLTTQRGLTAHTKSADIPSAMSGNCQTAATTDKYSPSPSHNAKITRPRPGSQSHTADFVRLAHHFGLNFAIAARPTPNTSGSSRVQV